MCIELSQLDGGQIVPQEQAMAYAKIPRTSATHQLCAQPQRQHRRRNKGIHIKRLHFYHQQSTPSDISRRRRAAASRRTSRTLARRPRRPKERCRRRM